jgi:hypothetical protein
MNKAYDRVERAFLAKVMRKLGFAEKWVDLITTCVTTVKYSVLINGEPSRRIRPSTTKNRVFSNVSTVHHFLPRQYLLTCYTSTRY